MIFNLLVKIVTADNPQELENVISAWLRSKSTFAHIEFHYSVCHESFSVLILYKEAPPE